jgi:hypothetical protein
VLVKQLAFTSVYFSESGLFNGLRAIQLKKFFSRLGSRSSCRSRVSKQLDSFPFLAALRQAKIGSASTNSDNTIF